MTLTLDIPDRVAESLVADGKDPARVALESFAIESWRNESLTNAQIREMLGLKTRMQLDAFLKERGVFPDYTFDDFLGDRENARRVADMQAVQRRAE